MKKKTHDELYWEMLKKQQLKKEYEQYLEEEGKENNAHSAQLFAIKKIDGGYEYMGIKEREIILFLAGELP